MTYLKKFKWPVSLGLIVIAAASVLSFVLIQVSNLAEENKQLRQTAQTLVWQVEELGGKPAAVPSPGPVGQTGPPGPKGEPGERGEPGVQGDPGVNGQSVTGPSGADGTNGQDGDRGPRGERGEPGAKGDTGERGADGADGEDGLTPSRLRCGQKDPLTGEKDCVVTEYKESTP